MQFLSGTRIQTLNGLVTTSFITGIAPVGSYMGNDNFLFTSWPYIGGGTPCYGGGAAWNTCTNNATTPGGGLSYTLYNSTTTVTGAVASVINVNGDPANEFPLHSQDGNGGYTPGPTITGPSYFMFQLLSDPNPMNCVPPAPSSPLYAATVYSFNYQSAPSTQNVIQGGSLWSSCAVGTWQMVGPFNVPSGPGTVTPQYAVVAATGTRTFATATSSQVVNITGVDGEDGGDFRVYSAAPYLDDAGVTFTTTRPAYFSNGVTVDTTSTNNYVNRQSPHFTRATKATAPPFF